MVSRRDCGSLDGSSILLGHPNMRNQKSINRKISDSLKGRGNGDISKNCEFCDTVMILPWSKRKKKFCSISCGITKRNLGSVASVEQKIKTSNSVKKTYENGKNVYGGKTKWHDYNGIKVQGTYELRACKILDNLKFKGLS